MVKVGEVRSGAFVCNIYRDDNSKSHPYKIGQLPTNMIDPKVAQAFRDTGMELSQPLTGFATLDEAKAAAEKRIETAWAS